ncbi:MAG: glutamate--tRNA ligase [Candidatus Auribacter fodinae]|jgi:glutamyl-tRNA synthetase|uniref:Glutamate--tRNA ligase n=1 Tax=Candidatus Auribacter fodinae TaxID=2093366 RepID=A0A3A4RC11_9BACT|nr:MAG: glutamate--tRNA ligase [Candidatus Auribacter fodinae]
MTQHNDPVRVRFAPSPTGYLHIGGARTALFNWLFAHANNGKMILRIEDTDRERSTLEDVDRIIESLKWLGLNWDEGPFFQSERKELYREYAQKLIDQGLAYYSDEQRGEHQAIIFSIPNEKVVIDDIIHGPMEFDNSLIKDLVIFKSDGFPTYNFACVVDDALMGITHIIRGDDHISNTPKQIPLYKALGFPVPKFAHVPLILGKDKSRLSKRHGATSVQSYQEEGFLPDALVNFLALLGWSPGDNRELMNRKELISLFSLERISSKNSVFDDEKLRWMNSVYIRESSYNDYKSLVMPFLKSAVGDDCEKHPELDYILSLLQERLKVLNEISEQSSFFFTDDFEYDEKSVAKRLLKPEVPEILSNLIHKLAVLEEFTDKTTENAARELVEEMGISGGAVIHPVRVALTGVMTGPGLFEIMQALGKEKCLIRIQNAIDLINSRSSSSVDMGK